MKCTSLEMNVPETFKADLKMMARKNANQKPQKIKVQVLLIALITDHLKRSFSCFKLTIENYRC